MTLTKFGEHPAVPLSCRLDRAALAAGAAGRRARLADLEAWMTQACEDAASQAASPRSSRDRRQWDRRTWSCDLDEAIRQAGLHGHELSQLRRDAQRLDHLATIP